MHLLTQALGGVGKTVLVYVLVLGAANRTAWVANRTDLSKGR